MFGVDFVDHFYSLVFLDCVSPFNICCKAGFVAMNSLTCCSSEKLLVTSSILKETLARYSNICCRFFSFIALYISCHSLLACRVSVERSAVKHMGFLLYITCCFYLATFNIISLCFIFLHLISMCLGMFLLGFIPNETLCTSWIWLTISFSMLGIFQL